MLLVAGLGALLGAGLRKLDCVDTIEGVGSGCTETRPWWLLIASLALGAYAVYRLVRGRTLNHSDK